MRISDWSSDVCSSDLQANEDYSALVTNEAEGRIIGQRYGIILSGGGDVVNAGELLGGAGGLYIQGTALNSDPNEERSGLTASVVNSGTIHGLGDFGGTYTKIGREWGRERVGQSG